MSSVQKTNIKGVIFDLDGTLVHTIEDIAFAANEMFRRNGLQGHDVSYYLKWIGSGVVKFIERALRTEVEEEQLAGYVREFKEIYEENLHEKSRVYDGVPEVLDEMVSLGIRISILSNKPHHLTMKVAEFYLSDWPFHPVFGQRSEVPRKPDPAAAMEIAQWMDLDPSQMLLVGDSDNDILTARAAGMIPQGVTWGYGRLKQMPVEESGILLDHPSELISILQ